MSVTSRGNVVASTAGATAIVTGSMLLKSCTTMMMRMVGLLDLVDDEFRFDGADRYSK